jgi:methylated-DNA-[protein]-cysteine S-methyltransferase
MGRNSGSTTDEAPFRLRTPHGKLEFRATGSPAMRRRLLEAAQALLRQPQLRPRLDRLPPGTPFQRACWRAACRIAPGETRTYAWLAAQAGTARAARAAAQAMRRNPWPLVIPCHRVVSAGGLGGYAGTSDPADRRLRLKRWLLARERRAVE